MRRKSIIASAIVTCAFAAFLFLSGFTSVQPTGATLSSNPLCSGNSDTDSVLSLNSSVWCGSATPTVKQLTANGGSAGSGSLNATTQSTSELAITAEKFGDANYRLEYDVGQGLFMGNGTAAPVEIIGQTGIWGGPAIGTSVGGTGLTAYPAPTLNGCNPSSNTSIPANTPTTVCSGSTGTLPAAPDGTYVIYSTALAYIVLGATGGSCAEKITAGSFTATAEFGPSAASTGDSLSTLLITEPSSSSSISFSLIVECTVAATVEVNDSIFSTVASGASILIMPQ